MAAHEMPTDRLSSVDEQVERIVSALEPLHPYDQPLLEALGLPVCENISAPMDLPSFDNSAMDGYAVYFQDVATATEDHPVHLPVVGEMAAGQTKLFALSPGTAVRIMTGAPVPQGADAIVPVEWTDGGVATVRITRAPELDQHVRHRGEDVQHGDVLLEDGSILGPRQLGLLASVGRSQVRSRPRPRIVIMSTGAELREPGTVIGSADGTPVIAVGSHDTASAVVGVPAGSERFAYISCGTWSLVGVELEKPVLTEESRAAGFTNELGVDGTVRYLHNVMGLWLLQECQRAWAAAGLLADLPDLLAGAAQVPAFTAVVDADDPRFLPPGNMPNRIAEACAATGQTPPQSQAETVRCILDSLALAYRRTVRRAAELSGRDIDVVHLVGGGARNTLLCQLTADACGLPVLAGPVEAAALGNALVQARSAGVLAGGLAELRALLRTTQDVRRHLPTPGAERAWQAAEERVSAR